MSIKLKDIEKSQIQMPANKNVSIHSFASMSVALSLLVGGALASFKIQQNSTPIQITICFIFKTCSLELTAFCLFS